MNILGKYKEIFKDSYFLILFVATSVINFFLIRLIITLLSSSTPQDSSGYFLFNIFFFVLYIFYPIFTLLATLYLYFMKKNNKKFKDVMNISVVTLGPEDWKVYKMIWLEALHVDPQAFKDQFEELVYWTDEQWKEKVSDPARIFVVAFDANTPIGLVACARDKKDAEGMVIMRMFVKSTYRGRGIGKKLMTYILETIRHYPDVKRIKLWVSVTQKAAYSLYKSLGFVKVGEETMQLGKDAHTTIVMTKQNP